MKRILTLPVLIVLSVNLFAVNTFQYKQILPSSQWSDYTPDRPHTAVLMGDDGNIIVASQAFSSECIVMQKIDPYGNPLWADPETGLKLVDNTTATDVNYYPSMASDGNGGVYITYAAGVYAVVGTEWRFYFDTYLQHLDADGNKQWSDKGLLLKTGSYPWDIASDGDGGVYVLYDGDSNCDYYPGTLLQHVNKEGEKKYTGSGYSIMECDSLYLRRLYPDGNNGIFISNENNYLQRMNVEGEFFFPIPYLDTGLPNLQYQWFFNNGETIIIAGKEKGTRNFKIQKLSADGEYLWDQNGYTYTWPDSLYFYPSIIQNNDSCFTVFSDLYTKKININKSVQFYQLEKILDFGDSPPSVLYSKNTKQFGTFVLYAYSEYLNFKYRHFIIFQKIDNTGSLPWGVEGVTLCDSSGILLPSHSLFTINEQTGTAQVFLEFHYGLHVAIVDLKTGTLINEKNNKIPENFSIKNYPNPFNYSTTIQYTLDKPGQIKLSIYNIHGQKVTTLLNSYETAGEHRLMWDGTTDRGEPAASGIYFVKLTRDEATSELKRVLLLK